MEASGVITQQANGLPVDFDCWNWAVANWGGIVDLAAKACRHFAYLVDELVGEALDRIPSIVAGYRPERGATLFGHLRNNLRWYFHKFIKRHESSTDLPLIEDITIDRRQDQAERAEVRDSLRFVFERLTLDERQILFWRCSEDRTFREIGLFLGLSESSAHARCHKAIAKAKAIAARIR